MASECERTRLIEEIARLLGREPMPDDARTAALTLIGWLARRMPGECAHALGVEEALSVEEALRVPRVMGGEENMPVEETNVRARGERAPNHGESSSRVRRAV